jgi:hypothetical protein
MVRGVRLHSRRLRQLYHGRSGQSHVSSRWRLDEEEEGFQLDPWYFIAVTKVENVITLPSVDDTG